MIQEVKSIYIRSLLGADLSARKSSMSFAALWRVLGLAFSLVSSKRVEKGTSKKVVSSIARLILSARSQRSYDPKTTALIAPLEANSTSPKLQPFARRIRRNRAAISSVAGC